MLTGPRPPHVADEDGGATPACASLGFQSPVTHRVWVRGGLVVHEWPEALALWQVKGRRADWSRACAPVTSEGLCFCPMNGAELNGLDVEVTKLSPGRGPGSLAAHPW